MVKVINCPCGVVLRGPTDEEVVRLAQQHAKEGHNVDLTTEAALSMAHPEQRAQG